MTNLIINLDFSVCRVWRMRENLLSRLRLVFSCLPIPRISPANWIPTFSRLHAKNHKNLHLKPNPNTRINRPPLFSISQSAIIEFLTLKHSHHLFSQTRPIHFHSSGISFYPFLIQNVDLHTCPSPIKVETCCTCTSGYGQKYKIAAIANKLKGTLHNI